MILIIQLGEKHCWTHVENMWLIDFSYRKSSIIQLGKYRNQSGILGDPN